MTRFSDKIIEQKCILIFPTTFVWNGTILGYNCWTKCVFWFSVQLLFETARFSDKIVEQKYMFWYSLQLFFFKCHDFRIKLLNKNVFDFPYNFCLKRHDFRIKLLNKNTCFDILYNVYFEMALFSDKIIDKKMCILIFPTTFVWNGTTFR